MDPNAAEQIRISDAKPDKCAQENREMHPQITQGSDSAVSGAQRQPLLTHTCIARVQPRITSVLPFTAFCSQAARATPPSAPTSRTRPSRGVPTLRQMHVASPLANARSDVGVALGCAHAAIRPVHSARPPELRHASAAGMRSEHTARATHRAFGHLARAGCGDGSGDGGRLPQRRTRWKLRLLSAPRSLSSFFLA